MEQSSNQLRQKFKEKEKEYSLIQLQDMEPISQIDLPDVFLLKKALNQETIEFLTKQTLDKYIHPPYLTNWNQCKDPQRLSKTYPEENYTEFPPELAEICLKYLPAGLNMRPEGAIVNIYGEKSRLGGHFDVYEECMDKPLVTLSIGLSSVFLLGCLHEEYLNEEQKVNQETSATNQQEQSNQKIIPILLESGDILIVSGKSRTRMHGVPKIFKNSYKLSESQIKIDFLNMSVNEFLQKHRINISIRQVKK